MTDGHNVTPTPVDKPRVEPDLARDAICARVQEVATRIAARNHSASQLRRLDEAVAVLESVL